MRVQNLFDAITGTNFIDFIKAIKHRLPLRVRKFEALAPAFVYYDSRYEKTFSGLLKRFAEKCAAFRIVSRCARSCMINGTKAPTIGKPNSLATLETSSGVLPRYPTGPCSVAFKPTAFISPNTVRASSWNPQSGTSQTPHEIGFPTSRSTTETLVLDIFGFLS
jgi:hypothetical protein